MQEVTQRVLWKIHIKIKQDIETVEQIDTNEFGKYSNYKSEKTQMVKLYTL